MKTSDRPNIHHLLRQKGVLLLVFTILSLQIILIKLQSTISSRQNNHHKFPLSNEWFQVGNNTGTDKVNHHYYHVFYPKYVNQALLDTMMSSSSSHRQQRRHNNKKQLILELGYYKGESARLWRQLYPWTELLVVDRVKQYQPWSLWLDNQFHFLQSDLSSVEGVQSVVNYLKSRWNNLPRPSVIVDDASHLPEHQIMAVQVLFEILAPGGVYIIEDIEVSHWRKGARIYGYNVTGDNSIMDFFSDLSSYLVNGGRSGGGSSSGDGGSLSSSIESVERAIDFMGGIDNAESIAQVSIAYNCVIIRKKS